MPRPSHQAGSPRASQTESRFFVTKLLRNREERRRQKQEQAAKAITNNRAENENMIIDTLASINFVRSEIPAEILDHKSNPEQPWGDLEFGARAIQSMLKNAPNFTVNTTVIDEKLLQLAYEFKNAVATGNVKAAYAAKGALVTCIDKIRNRIPNVKAELVNSFIENGAKYMDTWILLVDSSREADELEKNVKTEKSKYDKNVADAEAASEDLKKKIKENDDYLSAFVEISDKTAPDDPTKWTKSMLEVRKMLVDQKFSDVNLGLTFRILQGEEIKLKEREGRIETLSAKVGKLPVPEDPDAINKYNEEVDAIFDELAAIDTEVDELLTTIETIEGRMESLDNAPGAVHLRNTIAQQAEEFIKSIQEEQDRQVASQGVNRDKLFKKLNIRSDEEQKEMIKQAEAERERIMQEAMIEQQNANVEYVSQEDTEAEQLYNEE